MHHDLLDIIGPLDRILTAALNDFCPPLVSTDASDAKIACEMLRKAEMGKMFFQQSRKRAFLQQKPSCATVSCIIDCRAANDNIWYVPAETNKTHIHRSIYQTVNTKLMFTI